MEHYVTPSGMIEYQKRSHKNKADVMFIIQEDSILNEMTTSKIYFKSHE